MNNYPVVQIPASKFKRQDDLEGAAPKGWVNDPSLGEVLFKNAVVDEDLPDCKSDWSEKVISELNQLLSLPAARYELASIIGGEQQIPGTVSLDLSQPEDRKRITLETYLEKFLPQYSFPGDYTAKNVIDALENNNVGLPPNFRLPKGIENGDDMFVGMLVLDALVGNNDRHDNNIDLILQTNGQVYLSPSFDHGFSLGAVAKKGLKESISIEQYTKDHNYSVFVDHGRDLTGLEVFQQAAELRPLAAKIWLKQLSKVNTRQIEQIFNRVPSDRITPDDSKFAQELIKYNQAQLLGLQKELSQNTELKFNSEKLQNKSKIDDQTSPISSELDQNLERDEYDKLAEQTKAKFGTLNQFQLDIEICHLASTTGDQTKGQELLQQSDLYLQLQDDDPQKAENYLDAIKSVTPTYKRLPEDTAKLDSLAERLVNSHMINRIIEQEAELSPIQSNEIERQNELS